MLLDPRRVIAGRLEPIARASADIDRCDAAIAGVSGRRKDLRFAMGLSATRVGEPMRRDRLLLVSAFATAQLTLLGAVGESLGMDRQLKSNTSKSRTHSLFRQGCMLTELIPNMPEHRLLPLMQAFARASQTHPNSADCLLRQNEGIAEVCPGIWNVLDAVLQSTAARRRHRTYNDPFLIPQADRRSAIVF
jgi:hypothetical protein